eukprot:6700941-Ditylum_brightwellii.AAC.2
MLRLYLMPSFGQHAFCSSLLSNFCLIMEGMFDLPRPAWFNLIAILISPLFESSGYCCSDSWGNVLLGCPFRDN